MTAPKVVRIPADVDRPDRLLAGLTARQLLYLAAGALVGLVIWSAMSRWLPLPVVAVGLSPVAAVLAVVVWGRYDGLDADRLAIAWWRHHRTPRQLVPAPDGIPPLPHGLPGGEMPGPLTLPIDGIDHGGLVDLGRDGTAVICTASSVNFGLRTDAEQHALVAVIGRWLNSLGGPVEIVVRAERVDLTKKTRHLRGDAAGLPHPALETAAVAHASFLDELAGRPDVLRRTVLLVFREHGTEAGEVLARRADDATRALAVAGIRVERLDTTAATAAIAKAMEPTAPARHGTYEEDIVRGTRR